MRREYRSRAREALELMARMFGAEVEYSEQGMYVIFIQRFEIRCPTCDTTGKLETEIINQHGEKLDVEQHQCYSCKGYGRMVYHIRRPVSEWNIKELFMMIGLEPTSVFSPYVDGHSVPKIPKRTNPPIETKLAPLFEIQKKANENELSKVKNYTLQLHWHIEKHKEKLLDETITADELWENLKNAKET